MPSKPWIWRQSWYDLAFLHFRVNSASIQAKLPRGIQLQTFDGSAWVGLVPFRLAGMMRRPIPSPVSFPSFPELNLRTYVEVDGKPGVWFFSLDTTFLPLVIAGQNLFQLPYHSAQMTHVHGGEWFSFASIRGKHPATRFTGSYRPVGEVTYPQPGTFEHWVAERYCLYSHSSKGTIRLEVHHAPWPMQKAEAIMEECTILQASSVFPEDPLPVCHFSTGVDVVSYAPERVGPAARC